MTGPEGVFKFFLAVEALGLIAWPLVRKVFRSFPDQGWSFSKIIGIVLTAWLAWLLSFLHLVSFNREHTLMIMGFIAALCWVGLRPEVVSLRLGGFSKKSAMIFLVGSVTGPRFCQSCFLFWGFLAGLA